MAEGSNDSRREDDGRVLQDTGMLEGDGLATGGCIRCPPLFRGRCLLVPICVAQGHIQRGLTCSPTRCPVSLAIREETGLRVLVMGEWIEYGDGSVVQLGRFIRAWIADYDDLMDVSPTRFVLRVPPELKTPEIRRILAVKRQGKIACT